MMKMENKTIAIVLGIAILMIVGWFIYANNESNVAGSGAHFICSKSGGVCPSGQRCVNGVCLDKNVTEITSTPQATRDGPT
jgi:hypothetical protein